MISIKICGGVKMLKFLSLLGNGKYEPCYYYLNEPANRASECHYIQHSLLEILEKQGVVPDEVTVLMTDVAYNENWITNKKDSNAPGLRELLTSYSRRSGAKVKPVLIPAGTNETEIWQLFIQILDCIDEGDQVILDITHSFRYIPMLTLIALNYARVVKGCKIRDIYYGAYNNSPDKHEPIFVLTPFVTLFDWIIGVERYLATGDAIMLQKLTREEVSKLNKEISVNISEMDNADRLVLFRDPKALKELSQVMLEFSEIVRTCRGPRIQMAALKVKESIDFVLESAAHERIKPLSPLMELLKQRFDSLYTDDELKMAVEAAQWCLDNRMYQQGFTILQEGLITIACKNEGKDHFDKNKRGEITSRAYALLSSEKNQSSESKHNQILKLIASMANTRNDINHAGWREQACSYTRFEETLREFIGQAAELIDNNEEKVSSVSSGKAFAEKNMLLIFSHELTEAQCKDAKTNLDVGTFIEMPTKLASLWSNVPPELDNLEEYLIPIKGWLLTNAKLGDYALVQGDFGATLIIVEYCKAHGIIPVYSTTKRQAVETKVDGKVITTRQFEHVQFRLY